MERFLKTQLDFIAYIQRLLVEGDFVATYKFALLHAIADICVEKPLHLPTDKLTIKQADLVEHFLKLYWQHAMPFSGQVDDGLLKQNAGRQAKIITTLHECQQAGFRNVQQLKQSPNWQSIFSSTWHTIKEGPIWRLQILSKEEDCFLYPHERGSKEITLNAGIAYCFRRFYDLVTHLAKTAWVEKIQTIKHNQILLGDKTQLTDFLFGVNRSSLIAIRPFLIELQKDICFYCNKRLGEPTPEVDHFIPFARYANDLGHNFVVAHRSCNNAKRDHLAALHFRDKWQRQNLEDHQGLITQAVSPYFYCDAEKSRVVSDWAYRIAEENGSRLWAGEKEFVSFATTTLPQSGEVIALNTKTGKESDEDGVTEQTDHPQIRYFPNLKIACGHFKTGDDSDVEMKPLPEGVGHFDETKHFLARASGNSMNGGKNPILDGDLLLLELMTPDNAGSITGSTLVIEHSEYGENQYLLRDVKSKKENEFGEIEYELVARNSDYQTIYSNESLSTFARLKKVIKE